MIGAIVGDIVGSRFERHNHRSKDFELFVPEDRFTDDTVLTLAVADALVDEANTPSSQLSALTTKKLREYGRRYPNAGYGGRFIHWLCAKRPHPYNSFGNGAAMRVSACGWAAQSLDEAKALARAVTKVTHDHPEGLRGAEAVAAAVFLARTGASKEEIREVIEREYYPLDFKIEDIKDSYKFNVSCQGSVPQAIEAFLESSDFEDAIRTAVSVGGDSDTIAAITGSIAEAYYGVPVELRRQAEAALDTFLLACLRRVEQAYPPERIMIKGTKNMIDFDDCIANISYDTAVQLTDVGDAMDAYERHI